MRLTLMHVLALVLVPGACGPSSPEDLPGSTESTGSLATTTTVPTTTMPTPDMGAAEDPQCPSPPPLAVDDCVPVAACPETTVLTSDVVIASEEDVAALACVREIRGDLDIFDFNSEHLAGLERLERVRGSIRISTVSGLTDLRGLCGLTAVDARANGIGGDFKLDFNIEMTELTGLARLERVAGSLRIEHNSALVSMRGLASLTSVGVDLEVRGNTALESLRGLDLLAAVPEVVISDDDGLADLCGLHGLTMVDSLVVVGNSGLRTLWGAHNLGRAIIEVDIAGNDELVDLGGLRSLFDVPHLKVRHNAALQSLAGLDALAELKTLAVSENDALLKWQPPAQLVAVQHLDICGNDGLTSLDVTDLAVDRLTVIYNDSLGDAAGEAYAASLVVPTIIKIARNSPPPYQELSPCPWVGDGTCDEDEASYEDGHVYCGHDDCCGDSTPLAMCALGTDDPRDCHV